LLQAYPVKTRMVRSGSLLSLGTHISIVQSTQFTEETMRARSSLGVCSAALVAGSSFATLAQALVNRVRCFRDSPIVENRPTKNELLFQRATQTYLWAMPRTTRWA
jgi:hypothetical protein